MFLLLYICVISGVLLLGFSLFLNAETIRGRRIIMANGRERLDLYLERTLASIFASLNFIGGKVIRLSLHFLVHQILGFVLNTLRFLESHISKLQWRNRIMARRVRLTEVRSHLELIAEHQEENALTDKQKQKLKDKSISG